MSVLREDLRINHYHRCEHCGTEWSHGLSDPGGPDYAKAHDCPQCGRNQRWVSRWESDLERLRFDIHMLDHMLRTLSR